MYKYYLLLFFSTDKSSRMYMIMIHAQVKCMFLTYAYAYSNAYNIQEPLSVR